MKDPPPPSPDSGQDGSDAGPVVNPKDAGPTGSCAVSCDDQNVCTTDSCVDGECVNAPNTGKCEDDGDACTDDVCNSGSCTHPSNNSSSDCKCSVAADCDDGNPCTDESCSAVGLCSYTASIKPCQDDGVACTDDVCSNGFCQHPNKLDETTCDDGDACSGSDVCRRGVCTAGPNVCDCKQAADCNNTNTCQTVTCTAGKCVYANVEGACKADTNECTDDVCKDGVCTPVNTTAGCTADTSSCTDDVCQAGACTHELNSTCECLTVANCVDDKDPCTCDSCTGGKCEHLSEAMCPAAGTVVINSFDNNGDWTSNLTTPNGLKLVKSTFGLTNIESTGNNLYVAAPSAGSIEMEVPSLLGTKNLVMDISSEQTNTASMVEIGVFSGTTWVDKTLASLSVVVPTAGFETITIPFSAYAVGPCTITKVRIKLNPTGDQKIWRFRDLVAK